MVKIRIKCSNCNKVVTEIERSEEEKMSPIRTDNEVINKMLQDHPVGKCTLIWEEVK